MKMILGDILKLYLWLHELIHERVFHSIAIRYYDGLHPKNIFNYRTEFFIENVDADDVVVDVACGTGRILGGISKKIHKGIGIDYDANNIRLAEKNFSAPNLQFTSGDIFSYNYSELGHNKAVFSHILEHVENVPALLRKVNARELLICVPSQENWYRQTIKSLGLNYKTDPTHFREYSREMLVAELKEADYTTIYIGFNQEGEIICRARLNK